MLDWLRVEYAIDKPGQKLSALTDLDSDAFVAEVKKLRGKKQPLTAATLAALRDEHTRSIAPARQQATEALHLELKLSDLVNEAYGLTPEEVMHMWAPPRCGCRFDMEWRRIVAIQAFVWATTRRRSQSSALASRPM